MIAFAGTRFNVLFFDAAAVYFHRNHIKSFIAAWPNANKLLQAVSEDIENKVNIAGIRALGIIDKVVTGHFWRMSEKPGGILHANPYLETMRIRFTQWCDDASPLLDGELLFDEADIPIHRDETYHALFVETGDTELDILTQQALELMMHSLLLLLERQAQDQILQGKYAKPDVALASKAHNVPCTNAASERDFGILDLLIRMKPASTVLLYESLTMWMNNKTSEWLCSKTHSERIHLLREARNSVPLAQAKYKERMVRIRQARLDALLEKQRAKENPEQKRQEKKVVATNNIVPFGGVWLSDEDVDEHLRDLPKCDVRGAVSAQLKFHKHVLQSKGDRDLFFQSRTVHGKRVILTEIELIQNLKKIIRLNQPDKTGTEEEARCVYRSTLARGTIFRAEKARLARSLKEARIKRAMFYQKQKLPIFETDPTKLVSCTVKHHCIEENSEEEAWYTGMVIGIVKTNRNAPLRTVFEIEYEIDSSRWNFPLLSDMKKGDLIVDNQVPGILEEE